MQIIYTPARITEVRESQLDLFITDNMNTILTHAVGVHVSTAGHSIIYAKHNIACRNKKIRENYITGILHRLRNTYLTPLHKLLIGIS